MTKENPESIAEYKDALDTALAKVSSQETEIKQLKDQVQESTDAMSLINKQFEAASAKERDAVIAELVSDSQGKIAKENLKDHSLKELYFLKDTLAKAEPKSFVSVMKQREQDAQKPPVHGTMGGFNASTGKYEGGIPV